MTKIHIVSGFLGAGKTTLIKYLLQGRQERGRVAIVENEFGQVGLDKSLLTDGDLQILELSSGCICCSLTGDFRQALQKLVNEYAVDEIIIEPSGVGLISDIKLACYDVINARKNRLSKRWWWQKTAIDNGIKLNPDLQIGTAVTVIDGKKYRRYLKNFQDFFVDQVAGADEILLTRTEMLTDLEKQAVIEELRIYNQNARIHLTSLSDLAPAIWNSVLLDRQDYNNLVSTKLSTDFTGAGKSRKPLKVRRLKQIAKKKLPSADEVFTSLSYRVKECSVYTAEALRVALQAGDLGMVERFKGLVPLPTVNSTTADTANNWLHLEYAGGEWQRRLHAPAERSLLIFIGSDINKEALESFFKINELEFTNVE